MQAIHVKSCKVQQKKRRITADTPTFITHITQTHTPENFKEL